MSLRERLASTEQTRGVTASAASDTKDEIKRKVASAKAFGTRARLIGSQLDLEPTPADLLLTDDPLLEVLSGQTVKIVSGAHAGEIYEYVGHSLPTLGSLTGAAIASSSDWRRKAATAPSLAFSGVKSP